MPNVDVIIIIETGDQTQELTLARKTLMPLSPRMLLTTVSMLNITFLEFTHN